MRVLISGAGIAGPTLAWFLAQAGIDVTVVEKAGSMLAQGQNIDIRGTALHIVHKMGILHEIRKHNTTEKGTMFIDAHGNTFAHFPVQGCVASPTAEFEILRGDLVHVLYQATHKLDNVEYRFGTTVTEVLENTPESVKVRLSNGDVEQYDVLVAADGQWSRLRKEVFGEHAIQVVDKGAFSAFWTVQRQEQDTDFWTIHQPLRARVIETRPDNHGTLRASLSIMPASTAEKQAWYHATRSHDRKVKIDLIKSEYGDVGWVAPRLLAGLDTAPDLYLQAVQQIRLPKWHKNRVICLGDAAYHPTQFTGMGTALAIDGAYLLAGHLSQLQPGQHPEKAFEAYDKAFRPFVDQVQNMPWWVPGFAHPQYAWSRWILQYLLSTVSYILQNPWVVRNFKPKSKEEQGPADELDAPFPDFPAFANAMPSVAP